MVYYVKYYCVKKRTPKTVTKAEKKKPQKSKKAQKTVIWSLFIPQKSSPSSHFTPSQEVMNNSSDPRRPEKIIR